MELDQLDMGTTKWLTNGGSNSLRECIEKLEDTSIVFRHSISLEPPELNRAGRASDQAMRCLDHIVNEILRARDDSRSDDVYTGSRLNTALDANAARAASPISREQQYALGTAGIGCGSLPNEGELISMEKLLNKLKHRRISNSNFRIGSEDEHLFYIAVDKPNRDPDSIVELDIGKFALACHHIDTVLTEQG